MSEVRDPVCGMTIDSATAAGKSQHAGETYYFCSAECKQSFDADPERYAGKAILGDSSSELERHEPPFTKAGGIVAPKFGSASSGGAEHERLPEKHD